MSSSASHAHSWPDDSAPLLVWAEAWHSHGFRPIPLRSKGKNPIHDDWPNIPFHENPSLYFANSHAACNLGVACGLDGLIDCDLDCIEAVILWEQFFGPPTGLRYGHDSNPDSHWWYRVDRPVTATKYQDFSSADPQTGKNKARKILEVRGLAKDGNIGLQSAVPPSIHPSGERIRFEVGGCGLPGHIEADDLLRAAGKMWRRRPPGVELSGQRRAARCLPSPRWLLAASLLGRCGGGAIPFRDLPNPVARRH